MTVPPQGLLQNHHSHFILRETLPISGAWCETLAITLWTEEIASQLRSYFAVLSCRSLWWHAVRESLV